VFSHDFLLHLFRYDRENGVLYWENPPKFHPQLKGRKAGAVQHHGHTDYWFIKINGVPRLAHRLIWIIETGSEPEGDIDHIDGNGLNNRFSNLRDVTRRQNCSNRQVHRNGKRAGYYFCKHTKKWRTQCTIDGVRLFLGYFDSETEAHQRYLAELEVRGIYL
jgi:hypothetical protein